MKLSNNLKKKNKRIFPYYPKLKSDTLFCLHAVGAFTTLIMALPFNSTRKNCFMNPPLPPTPNTPRSCLTVVIVHQENLIKFVLVITCLRGKIGVNVPSSLFWNFEISWVKRGDKLSKKVDILIFLEWENSGIFQNNAINDVKQISLSHVIK